jgi:hypothetical protein
MAITEKNLTAQIPCAHSFSFCMLRSLCTIKKIFEKRLAKTVIKNKTKVWQVLVLVLVVWQREKEEIAFSINL